MPELETTLRATERGIIFGADSIDAIRAGRKAQTRRVAHLRPLADVSATDLLASSMVAGHYSTGVPESGWVLYSRGYGSCWNQRTERASCPQGKAGDRLWVREVWSTDSARFYPFHPVMYAASEVLRGAEMTRTSRDCREQAKRDEARRAPHGAECTCAFRWRSPFLMPRRLSRLVLEVTSSRLERLSGLTEADAFAEGYPEKGETEPPRTWYRRAWDSINGHREGCTWDDNPWVWVVSFKFLEGPR